MKQRRRWSAREPRAPQLTRLSAVLRRSSWLYRVTTASSRRAKRGSRPKSSPVRTEWRSLRNRSAAAAPSAARKMWTRAARRLLRQLLVTKLACRGSKRSGFVKQLAPFILRSPRTTCALM
ncbi:unnamed protein product [Amoebophrya sp. A120]|nr:unnamed protein product [Amoebophrya sp. A120]|eukprot:GSA120T00009984001.1